MTKYNIEQREFIYMIKGWDTFEKIVLEKVRLWIKHSEKIELDESCLIETFKEIIKDSDINLITHNQTHFLSQIAGILLDNYCRKKNKNDLIDKNGLFFVYQNK